MDTNSKTRSRAALNVLAWALIAVLAAATLVWTVWAGHQPKPHSIWGDASETPLN